MSSETTTNVPPSTEGGTGGVGEASPAGEASLPIVEEIKKVQEILDGIYTKNRFGEHVIFKTENMGIYHRYSAINKKAEIIIDFPAWWGGGSGYTMVFDLAEGEVRFVHWKQGVSPYSSILAHAKVGGEKVLKLYKHFLGLKPEKIEEVIASHLPKSIERMREKVEQVIADWLEEVEEFVVSLEEEEGEEDG
ncbi:MAG: hypothetical protein QW721_03090 [Desulfurococcaceae archaeon]